MSLGHPPALLCPSVDLSGLVRDPKDIPIALAAIQAKVDYLVTNDKDLTAQDETTAALREKIKPLIVGRFLREVMG